MSDSVWRANSKSAVENTSQERHSIAPPSSIVLAEIAPYGRITGMNFWHCGNNDDSDETTNNDQEETDLIQTWEDSVGKDHDGATEPSNQDKGNIDMPWVDYEIRMEDGVHLNRYIGRDGHD